LRKASRRFLPNRPARHPWPSSAGRTIPLSLPGSSTTRKRAGPKPRLSEWTE
jgi:hypothetical protein